MELRLELRDLYGETECQVEVRMEQPRPAAAPSLFASVLWRVPIGVCLAFALMATATATLAYKATSTQKGFDTCAVKTVAQMQNWWSNSPYYNTVVYIGGANRTCQQANLTASWVSSVHAQGWGLLPTWVGPQAPDSCNAYEYSSYISTDPATARNQGIQEATAAYNAASALGMDLTTIPLIYDLEGYTGAATCRTTIKSFMDGWNDYLLQEPGETFGRNAWPGVYGSACSSYLDDFSGLQNPPAFIWFAWWNGSPSTATLPSCMNASHWLGAVRHKQYVDGHPETWGGLMIKVDNDCSNGPVYDNVNLLSGPCPNP